MALFGLQATHKLPPSSPHRQKSTGAANAVFKITNGNKVTAADRDVTLCRLQSTHKPTLLLPQNCRKGGAGETGIFVCNNSSCPYSECSLRTDSRINPGNALMGCALAEDLAPDVAAVSPLLTGDRSSFSPSPPTLSRSSVSVRLLGVAVGVLDTNESRGTRGDTAFVVGALGGENPLHSSTPPAFFYLRVFDVRSNL